MDHLNDHNLQSKLPEMANVLYGDIPELVEKDLAYMFVLPPILDIRPYGFSDFGNTYYFSELLSQKLSKLLED